MDAEPEESELLHRFKNALALALGFCNLLLDEIEEDDPRKDDLMEIQQAILKATALLPDLAKQMK